MKIPLVLWLLAKRGFYRWAMREINPLHDDVPKIMHRQRHIEDRLSEIGW